MGSTVGDWPLSLDAAWWCAALTQTACVQLSGEHAVSLSAKAEWADAVWPTAAL